jgi:hypothetical protein
MDETVTTPDAVTTYRYVRIGLVAMVLFLAASIVQTRWKADGWQNSISAYFYTSSHSVFIASLCAVGICLIIYQGSTTTEDSLLNFSGFLAFVVGLVPTQREKLRGAGLPDDFCPTAFVENNVWALLIASVTAGAVLAIIARKTTRTDPPDDENDSATWQLPKQPVLAAVVGFLAKSIPVIAPLLRKVEAWLPWILLVALIAGAGVFAVDQPLFIEKAHGIAASVMFGGIIVVVVHYAWYALYDALRSGSKRRGWFVFVYLLIAFAMIVTVGIVIWLNVLRHDHGVILVEAIVIVEFALFWVAQSIDLWEIDKYPVPRKLSEQLKTLGEEAPV